MVSCKELYTQPTYQQSMGAWEWNKEFFHRHKQRAVTLRPFSQVSVGRCSLTPNKVWIKKEKYSMKYQVIEESQLSRTSEWWWREKPGCIWVSKGVRALRRFCAWINGKHIWNQMNHIENNATPGKVKIIHEKKNNLSSWCVLPVNIVTKSWCTNNKQLLNYRTPQT